MHKLYEWLANKLPCSAAEESTLIDVGAYHGNFSQSLLAKQKFSQARLFEPNSEHFSRLQDKFSTDRQISLYPYALGNEQGSHSFHCSQDDATGSLLPYDQKYHHEDAGKVVKASTIEVRRLDDFYEEHFPQDKVGLIKIDTQGFDLEVLQGAEKLIQAQKPWLVIELNFLPFYQGQAPLNKVLDWAMNQGYQLGGFFNDHYSSDQWLAFADGVFMPTSSIDKVREPFYPRLANEELLEENRYLKGVCEERLNLINDLNTIAVQRGQIIEKMLGFGRMVNMLKKVRNRLLGRKAA